MIIDDGWTTKLTIHDVTRPIIPLSTTPTRHLDKSMPIVPSESNITLANSLYECSNTDQLTNYYYACLNYPVKSTLTKAINRGYLKDWQGLTSQPVELQDVYHPTTVPTTIPSTKLYCTELKIHANKLYFEQEFQK